VKTFADTEFFSGKNFIARKKSGFEIFTRKNFRTKKFHVRKNRTLKFLNQKKSGFKNFGREKKSGMVSKNCPATPEKS